MTAPNASAVAEVLAAARQDLAKAIEDRDLTIRAAARAAGVDSETLRRWLSGDRASTQLGSIVRVCLAHEIPLRIEIGGGRAARRGKRRTR